MKRLFLVLAALAVVAVAVLVGLFATFDIDQYKPRLIAAVERWSGRDFDIAGEIALKPSLLPTLTVAGVSLGNAAWSGPEPMAAVERFEARVRLLPLLSRRLEISRIELIGARIRVEIDAAGRSNWQMAATDTAPGTTATPLPDFELRQVLIRDALIEYRAHEQAPLTASISTLELDSVGRGQPLSVTLSAVLNEHAVSAHGTVAPLAQLLRNQTSAVDLLIAAGDAELRVVGEVAQPLAATGINLHVQMQAPSLAALSPYAGVELPALAPLKLQANVSGELERLAFDDVAAEVGASDFAGRATLALDGPRPQLDAALTSRRLDLSFLDPPARAPGQQKARVFSPEPLPVSALTALDAVVLLRAGEALSRGRTFTDLNANATLAGGVLNLHSLDTTLDRGAVHGALTLDASGARPHLRAAMTIKRMALTRWFDGRDGVTAPSGTGNLKLDIDGHGSSPAEIMASADGHLLLDLRDLEIASKTVGLAGMDLLLQVLALLNPLGSKDPRTRVECAVVNFPIAQGRMESATGVGISTPELRILGGGSVDLKTEALDIGVSPKPRQGIGINLAGIADFVRLGGTLSHPVPVTDALGATTAGLKVGTAIATGGLSILAEGLLDRAGGDIDVCAVARGDQQVPAAKPASAPATITDKAGSALKGAGDAVKGVFKGLFGD